MPEVASVPSAETETTSPWVRGFFALAALALFRWSLFRPVSMETTAEVEAQDHIRMLIDRSRVAQRDHRYEDALESLKDLTSLQPSNHVYWWQRASVCGALHRPLEEADALDHYVKVAPLPGDACPRLGFLFHDLGMKEAALDAFKRCASFSPNDLEDAFYLGHAYELEGRVDEALEVYASALKQGSNADDEAGLGRMLLRKGRPDAAFQAVAPTLARNPHNSDALFVGGVALLRKGKYEEAEKLLQRGAARSDSSDFQYALGLLSEIQGRRDEAVLHYDAALALDPTNKDAKRRRSHFPRQRQ